MYGETITEKDDFEIITELDPLRDGSVYHYEVKKLYKEFKRLAVPDLFLRWGNYCLIIEAKFFTDPAEEDLTLQIKSQREAIKKVIEFTNYSTMKIKFVTLTINKTEAKELEHNDIECITWDNILEILSATTNSLDIKYCKEVLEKSITRAKAEFKHQDLIYHKLKFSKLMSDAPQLIKEGVYYIGFTGGIEALERASLNELENRSHYKISAQHISENWIPLDVFLKVVIKLQ